jgi:acetyl-CoA C-acetyltransferase
LIAEKWKLKRAELDEFSAQSHEKCAHATKMGYFDTQILPLQVDINGQKKTIKVDEGVRVPVDRQRVRNLRSG